MCILRHLDIVSHMMACEALTGRESSCPEFLFSRVCERECDDGTAFTPLLTLLCGRVRWWHTINPRNIRIEHARLIYKKSKIISWMEHPLKSGLSWFVEFAAEMEDRGSCIFELALNYAPLHTIEALYKPEYDFRSRYNICPTKHNWRWLFEHGYYMRRCASYSVLQLIDSMTHVEQDEFIACVGNIVSLDDIFSCGRGLKWHLCTPLALQRAADGAYICHIDTLLYLMQCPEFDLIEQDCIIDCSILMEFVNMEVCPRVWRGYLMADAESDFKKLKQKICMRTFLQHACSLAMKKAIEAGFVF